MALIYTKASVEGMGTVLPLTPEQAVTRALFLGGQKTLADLDEYITRDSAILSAWGYKARTDKCQTLYYQLPPPINGGRNPTLPDPAARWTLPGSSNVNRTVDCSGAVAWMWGFDRYLIRILDLLGGWANTDSKVADARRVSPRCFEPHSTPTPGDIIVCPSGSSGHSYGHEGVIVSVPADWNPHSLDSWRAMQVVHCAALGAMRCNNKTSAIGWAGPWLNPISIGVPDTLFVRPIMNPT